MNDRLAQIEAEIAALKERNYRVEGEKAWETSAFRVFSIAAATYAVSAVVLAVIGVQNFALAALVPMTGYVLSTLSLPAVRRWWVSTFYAEE